MYILCISPFLLARQFIQIYFKRIVDERKPKLRRWRIEYPLAFHYKTMRTNRSFSSFIFNLGREYPSNCILLRNYTFPRIINYSYREREIG